MAASCRRWLLRNAAKTINWQRCSVTARSYVTASTGSRNIEVEEDAMAGFEDEEAEEQFRRSEEDVFKLYEEHIPTTLAQKALLSVGSAVTALYNPYRSDMVATLGETTGFLARQWMLYKMKQDPVGRDILRLQPRVKSYTVPLDEMRSLPDGTFGREYAHFMDGNNLTQDARDSVKFIDDVELAYVMQRYRDIHDFMHTLTGLPTVSVAGEIAVKWFEMIQTGLPMCALGSVFGPLNPEVTAKQREELRRYYIPWAVSNGYKAKFIMNVFYERHFEEPIDSLRKKMNLTPVERLPGW